ncbi:GAF domain-containing protein [Rhodopseudomonas rhenobacensis]|uniref:GAF domain-containing protein n=1 Tax=Rhodopseudomonas rhenobacensis TaxID=87461 RepID=A0A7W8E0Q3_9BRAD|nr:GAF domain-containing protein [Rhodopseudomonas rhenobacensis]MBB5049157.1 GAF domain-containing protein [Rhodopseudomonas rhenobacensis]
MANRSGKVSPRGIDNDNEAAAGSDALGLLQKVVSGDKPEAAVGSLVSRLQFSSYAIADLIRDAGELKHRLTSGATASDRVLDGWKRLDDAVAQCLLRTSVSHERFIENTLHAFCEFDRNGTIIYGNAKMLAAVPDCLGRQLATLFGAMADDVSRLMFNPGPRELRELELKTPHGHRPVLAEFGRIHPGVDGNGYALLVDLSKLVDAERRAMEAAPLGMLRIDASQKILYANHKALEFLGQELAGVVGKNVSDFAGGDTPVPGEASAYKRRIVMQPRPGVSFTVLVTSVPSFDTTGAVVGKLVTLERIDHQLGRKQIAELVATEQNYAVLFDKIMAVVERFVPFDRAELRIYTPGNTYSRPICCYPKETDTSFARWFPIPEAFRNWWDRPHTWLDDIAEYLAESEVGLKVSQHPDTQRVLNQQIRSFVGVAVRKDGRLIGALNLLSKQRGIYNDETEDDLRRLAVHQVLGAVFNGYERDERAFVMELIQDISRSTDRQQLAKTVVTGLVSFFGYQYASIFKVNAIRGHFTMLAQSASPDSKFDVPDDFRWPLDQGILGLAYARKAYALLNDPDDGSDEAKAFTSVEPYRTKSELCVPLVIRGSVLWMLNLEDGRTHAFTSPEVELIRNIVDQMLPTIELLFQRLVLVQVFERFPQGAVLIELTGRILACSAEARSMFERDSVSNTDNIAEFLAPEAFEQLKPPGGTRVAAVVNGTRGGKTSVLLSSFTLSEEYDHVVVVIERLDELEWRRDFQALRVSLAEAATQVRVPLSLASTFVQQLEHCTSEVERADLVEKASRQLSRIELTYDRVMAAADLNRLSAEKPGAVNIRDMLQLILADLPKSKVPAAKLQSGRTAPVVVADAHRVHFVLASMLAYLLRARSSTAPIAITLHELGHDVAVEMTGAVRALAEDEALRDLVESARSQIALGEDVLKRVAETYGGSFQREDLPQGHVRLRLQLPQVAPQPRAMKA